MNVHVVSCWVILGLLWSTSCKTGTTTHHTPAEGIEISTTTPEETECPAAWRRTPESGDTLFAWAKHDNDFGTRADCKDSIGTNIVPEGLASYIVKSLVPHDNIGPHDTIQNVYQVRYSDSVLLFFVRFGLYRADGNFSFRIYAIDSSNGNFTKNAPSFFGGWMENDDEDYHWKLLEKPYCSFRDITGDGVPEIVVRKRTHMGTAFDTVEERYFRLTEEAELALILVVEPIALEMMNVDCVIKRELHGHTIETYLDCQGEEREKLGTIELAYREGTFNISDKQFTSPRTEYERFLLSSRSSESDSVFIHTGR